MPASSRPVPVGAADDVWLQHEAQIKDLYQNQRKTLREVKRLMEENGFPKTPLSTWESKLREKLQLRKKAKSHDWPLIYQHLLPRLEYPRKKQFKRKTIICLNGSTIPWDKAWKEIRRSGALGMDSHSTPNPLPPEVTIRSPSPVPFTSPPAGLAAQPAIPDMSTRLNPIQPLALTSLESSVTAPTLQTRSLTYAFSVYLLQGCASTIPWLEICQSMQPRAAQSQIRNGLVSSNTRLDLLRDNQPIPPRPSPDLGYRVAKSGGQIQLGQFISTGIFLLSNNLYDREDGDGGLELLCSILDRDAFLTTTLLQSHLPSVRAAWESLFKFSMSKRRKDTFRALTGMGIHNHWLDASRPGHCLWRAIEMDCYDIAFKVVVYCCESSCSHWWRDTFRAILEACRKGNIECAILLIQHCNVNARRVRRQNNRSMLQDLVANLDSSNDEYALALDLFLANGADVDKNCARKRLTRRWRRLVGRHGLLDATRPTILDEVFYLHPSLFAKVRPYSRVPVSRITRTGILVALENGSQTLRNYLSARQPGLHFFNSRHLQSLLELLLAEQFIISRTVDMNIVRGLFELGVSFEMPSVELDIKDFWRKDELDNEWIDSIIVTSRRKPKAGHICLAWHQFSNVKERMGLLNTLLAQGGVIGEHVLEAVVAQHRTGELECQAMSLPDFSTKAVRALVRAARLNNFEDVELLLRRGVDPNAFVISHGLSYSVPAVATQASFFHSSVYELPDGGCGLAMLQFLASHGARLVVTPEDSTPFDFANHLLRESNQSDLFAKIKYVLSKSMGGKSSSRLPSFLLESCLAGGRPKNLDDRFRERLEIFEYLFRQGAEVSPGSPLSALVNAGGREELVRDVLYSGSDLDASWANRNNWGYTPLQIAAHKGDESLVRLFLREGANVNSPGSGSHAMTALQAICRWPPATEEEHQRKMRICLLLIEQGADVNHASGGDSTILGEAATLGDLELAALLLREGADVNATSGYGTALDKAATSGCLDMVKFLLSANALSCVRGANGYDGAIYRAERFDNSAVADLIREHVAKVEAGTVFDPELMKAQDECRVFGFGNGYPDDNCETSSGDDAEDVV